MKKKVRILISVILLAVFCFSGWKLFSIWQEYRVGEETYESIERYVVIPETTASEEPQEEQTPEEESLQETEKSEILWPQVDFDALREINPDVVGWLYIEGTQINYPVLQGKDNDQYLYHMIDGTYNSAGSLFLQAGIQGDFFAPNNPVYGHNMKNGSMFAGLTGYKGQAFYEEHPVALLLTPEQNYQVRIFSAYVMDAGGDAWKTALKDSAMQDWLEERVDRSCLDTNVVPTAEDRILTLSTCTYETENARFLVHGILVPE